MLIWGATGGLGAYAVQMVKNGGGIPVGVVGSDAKAEILRGQGCDVVINRNEIGMGDGADGTPGQRSRWASARRADPRAESARTRTSSSTTWAGRRSAPRCSWSAAAARSSPAGRSTGYQHQYDNRYLWMHLKRIIGSHGANCRRPGGRPAVRPRACSMPTLSDRLSAGRGRPRRPGWCRPTGTSARSACCAWRPTGGWASPTPRGAPGSASGGSIRCAAWRTPPRRWRRRGFQEKAELTWPDALSGSWRPGSYVPEEEVANADWPELAGVDAGVDPAQDADRVPPLRRGAPGDLGPRRRRPAWTRRGAPASTGTASATSSSPRPPATPRSPRPPTSCRTRWARDPPPVSTSTSSAADSCTGWRMAPAAGRAAPGHLRAGRRRRPVQRHAGLHRPPTSVLFGDGVRAAPWSARCPSLGVPRLRAGQPRCRPPADRDQGGRQQAPGLPADRRRTASTTSGWTAAGCGVRLEHVPPAR